VEEGSFTRDLEGYVKEGSGDGHLSPWGPHWGNLEGGLLHRRLSAVGPHHKTRRVQFSPYLCNIFLIFQIFDFHETSLLKFCSNFVFVLYKLHFAARGRRMSLTLDEHRLRCSRTEC
jgi:hypothetical protein